MLLYMVKIVNLVKTNDVKIVFIGTCTVYRLYRLKQFNVVQKESPTHNIVIRQNKFCCTIVSFAVMLDRLIKHKCYCRPRLAQEKKIFSENLGLFRFVSVWYETVLFVSVVSIQVRNTETNRNFLLLVSRNKPKQTRNRSCFGLFRFEPKFIFVCFEDTLVGRGGNCIGAVEGYYSISRVPECLYHRRNWLPSPPPPQASVSSYWIQRRWRHYVFFGREDWVTQFRRLHRKPGTLCTV